MIWTIKYDNGQGLFCFFKIILRNLIEKQIMGTRKVTVDISNIYYPYKDDINETNNNLFEIIELNDSEIKIFKNILEKFQLDNNNYNELWSNYLNVEIKHKIFKKYFKLNNKIYDKVNNIYDNFNNKYIIGVHFRSHVSKISELRNTNRNYKIKNVNDYIIFIKQYILENNIKNYKIYLVTDMLTNIEIFKKEFQDLLIINENNKWLSKDITDVEPHFGFTLSDKKINDINFLNIFNKRKPGLNGAIELFVDIIVLSKCNVFFNSESNVSYFVKIMNPYQKTINIQDY
jgi:hypothetical protein